MRETIWRSSLSAGRKLILFYLLDHGAAGGEQHITATMLHDATHMSRAGGYSQLMWLVGQGIITRRRISMAPMRGPRYAYKINADALPWHGRRPPPAHQILRARESRAAL